MGVTTTTIDATDGRKIEVMHGDLADRRVAVVHNGTPGGLADWPWLRELADKAGLAVVIANRPGYGASTARAGRSVAMVAEDTAAVLDHLGVDEFVSIGISGGGPHAFADGALLGDRCRGVVDVAGLAPPDLDGLDFTDGMKDDNRMIFTAAAEGGAEALGPIAEMQEAMMAGLTAEAMLQLAPAVFPAVDAAVLDTPQGPAFAEFFAEMTRAAFTSGTGGLVDDMVALNRPWGFDLRDVQVPVTIWHGELDENVPVAHGRAIAAALPSPTTRFPQEHGHLSILLELPSIIDDAARSPRPSA